MVSSLLFCLSVLLAIPLAGFSEWAEASADPLAVTAQANGNPWSSLSATQREVLAPLRGDWASMDSTRQEKWLELASRYKSMPAHEQARVRARMAAWSKLSAAERGRARQQFQEARQLPNEQRKELWQQYQSLSEDERGALARQRGPAVKGAVDLDFLNEPWPGSSNANPNAKSNLVQAQPITPPKAVTNITVQAKPGATTKPMSSGAQPPVHHQPGMPKIVATPGFVDPATLLPKRGPQGAAVAAPAASAASEPAEPKPSR